MDERYQFQIIDAVMRVNELQKTIIVSKITSFFEITYLEKHLHYGD